MKILGTGMHGLVGSRIVELLKSKYEFESVSRSTGVDITNKTEITKAITDSDAEIVLHLAAKTDVDGCEKEKNLGENSDAWKINVEGTRNVADACLNANKKLLYVSTDFVFDGKIGEEDFYTEKDTPNPINWYSQTKYEGEKIVHGLESPWIILRLAYPYRAEFSKNDFVRAVLKRLQTNQEVTMITDHIFTPTFIDDFANAVDRLCMQQAEGIFHTVGNSSLSPYVAAVKIAEIFGLATEKIKQTTRAEFFQGGAQRPFRLAIKSDKIGQLGMQMRTFEEGLIEIKSQIPNPKPQK